MVSGLHVNMYHSTCTLSGLEDENKQHTVADTK